MDVVSTLKSRAQRERELLFKPPDYKLIEEQAAEKIEEMNNLIESVKSWYYIQSTDNANLVELAKILKI
jgi:hypothetical protein